ncbi:hypothetical protein B0H10DRAFT_2033986, partial [Mycena sp. CBHHK59/15]
MLFVALSKKTSLKTFSKNIIQKYHLLVIPDIIPNRLLAPLALMRQVAKPLVTRENKKGADTGFWSTLEDELEVLYQSHGEDRESLEWIAWEIKIIAGDDAAYMRGVNEAVAFSRQELDATAGSGENGGRGVVLGLGDVSVHDLGTLQRLR